MAGEDLRRYLILPCNCPNCRSHSQLNCSCKVPLIESPGPSREGGKGGKGTIRGINSRMMMMEVENNPAAPHDMSNICSLDNFLAAHQDVVTADNEAKALAKQQPPTKKIKLEFTDLPGALLNPNHHNHNANSSLPPLPVAIGARSSKHTILLHEKYQSLGIGGPEFVYEGDSSWGWKVKTTYLGEILDGGSVFTSKQEAKEALSEKVLKVVLLAEEEGRVKKPEKRSRERANIEQKEKERKEAGVNWSGQLLEFQRANNSPQPTYTDYQLGTSFTCLLTIDGLADHPEPFGDQTALYSSKKAARQHAAGCAAQYFKERGLWPEGVAAMGGIKKKKKIPATLVPISSSSPTAAHGSATMPVATAGTSYAQQAAAIATSLSLTTPEWRFTSEDSAPDFHTVSCYFRNGGPHAGPIGEVRHVFGKKKAKEECAKRTVEYLVGVREQRLDYGRRMMEGIEGGEDLAGSALDGAFEKERTAVVIKNEVSSDDDDFEDAVEF
ncbi:hypothetical protein K504DRAFT_462088 [Pleomassaria siparia CBS 279.74]|uniref:DRBM domain-containing protein n=1 Tax=Pleomassaria siparia CBS 279.74 TaxID=1314801 RepID=A0A6G1KM01_9PLEO|nr:hypothetical protein K504DRAFT_462088 [Pleomassaria siparia CBS 279.74]